MSVRVAARIPDVLAERIALRATAETRSLSNMIERLLELGLGVVADGSVLCSKVAFHGVSECSECGWSPPVPLVAVRDVREVTPDWKKK